ncbi:MAG: hypothetical protein GX478_09860 [Erysipelotrichaceae bacterium]|nr:hypothetical protein [Erysipelotrichaceae bacterium]
MRSIPYGYEFKDGMPCILPDEAEKVSQAFNLYLSGESLRAIGRKTGINRNHIGISNILADERYKGTGLYPKIVEADLFDKVAASRKKRKSEKNRKAYSTDRPGAATRFTLKEADHHYEDPFREAQYIYSLIQEKE